MTVAAAPEASSAPVATIAERCILVRSKAGVSAVDRLSRKAFHAGRLWQLYEGY